MWVWVQCHLLNCKWDTLFQMQRRKRTHVSYIMQICWRIMNRFVILALETGTCGGHSSLLDTSTVYLHSISPQTPESSESGPDLSLRNWVEWGKVTEVSPGAHPLQERFLNSLPNTPPHGTIQEGTGEQDVLAGWNHILGKLARLVMPQVLFLFRAKRIYPLFPQLSPQL